jgi:hypothetical protein
MARNGAISLAARYRHMRISVLYDLCNAFVEESGHETHRRNGWQKMSVTF